MLKSFIIFTQGVVVIWLSSMWAIIFCYILRDGGITIIEPCRPVLLTEFALALILVLLSVAAIVYVFIKR